MEPYVRRWAVQGLKPNGDRATTIFDLLEGRQRVKVYPATVDTFAVVIGGASVAKLAESARSHRECRVPARHAEHGECELGLQPNRDEAMELFVAPSGNSMRIVYEGERLRLLTETFGHIVDWLMP